VSHYDGPSTLSKERSRAVSPRYKDDFYSWARHQSHLLLEGRIAEADCANIAEELADLGRSERRSLRRALGRVMQHLLKWDFQPSKRTASWQKSIDIQRVHASQDLRDNPSLKSELNDIVGEAYELAVRYVAKDTGLPRDAFPTSCPYTFEAVMTREVGAERS
jgi:hypothetical protein